MSGTIRQIDVASCSLPLEKPISLGSMRITTRDYVCLRITTSSGIEGFAIGYKSGGQTFEGLQVLSQSMIGRDSLMRSAINVELEASYVPARASYVRAFSLIDVALWDIAAKASGLPLYILLGGLRSEVPAMPVLGFSHAEREISDIEDEIERHRADGETLVKVMVKGTDADANSSYLRRLASTFGGKLSLAVDVHWSWRSIGDAMDTCRRIDDCGLAFIEDPFLPQQWRLVGELRSKLKTAVAVGEDVLDPYHMSDLVQNVDILRIDATGSGGVGAAMSALSLASAAGRKAIPHVFPYLHLHLAGARPGVGAVEYIPEHTGVDPVRKLLKSFPPIRNGNFQIPDNPGAGCDLHWAAVEKHAAASATFQ